MTAYELVRDAPGHLGEVKGAYLACELGVDNDLEEEVAELVA